jgi:DNA polymerase-3 subunit alpha
MHELTPRFVSNKGYATTHFDMDAVEVIGLVKIDVLAQGGLAAIRDVKAALAQRGIEVDLQTCTAREAGRKAFGEGDERSTRGACAPQWQDPQVWEMISGGARAVHHIESPAMTSLCRQCNVRDIDTLIAIVSVIRPGAANEGKKLAFTRRYQELEPVTYPHPSLEPVLRDAFGLVVYPTTGSDANGKPTRQKFADGSAVVTLPDGGTLIVERALAKASGIYERRPAYYNNPPPPVAILKN